MLEEGLVGLFSEQVPRLIYLHVIDERSQELPPVHVVLARVQLGEALEAGEVFKALYQALVLGPRHGDGDLIINIVPRRIDREHELLLCPAGWAGCSPDGVIESREEEHVGEEQGHFRAPIGERMLSEEADDSIRHLEEELKDKLALHDSAPLLDLVIVIAERPVLVLHPRRARWWWRHVWHEKAEDVAPRPDEGHAVRAPLGRLSEGTVFTYAIQTGRGTCRFRSGILPGTRRRKRCDVASL